MVYDLMEMYYILISPKPAGGFMDISASFKLFFDLSLDNFGFNFYIVHASRINSYFNEIAFESDFVWLQSLRDGN